MKKTPSLNGNGDFFSGPDRIRTDDPHNANVVRSQLRYKPITIIFLTSLLSHHGGQMSRFSRRKSEENFAGTAGAVQDKRIERMVVSLRENVVNRRQKADVTEREGTI